MGRATNGGGERCQLRADTAAEGASELAGGRREHRRLPIRFERRCEAAAEEVADGQPVESRTWELMVFRVTCLLSIVWVSMALRMGEAIG